MLYVGRPAQGQPESTVGLFRVLAGTNEAQRVKVELGRALGQHDRGALAGSAEGDKVILSDMSAWDAHDRVRIK